MIRLTKQRRIIAIDCDDVLVETSPYVIDHYNKTYGAHLGLRDTYSEDLAMWKAPSRDEAIRRVEEYLKTPGYQTIPPFEETVRTIKKLAEYHELHVVTGRTEFLSVATEAMLAQYFPDIFTSIEYTGMFSGHNLSKGDVCEQIRADLLIDDHMMHAEQVAAKGIQVLLFGEYPWNQGKILSPHITRVRDWAEVEKVLL